MLFSDYKSYENIHHTKQKMWMNINSFHFHTPCDRVRLHTECRMIGGRLSTRKVCAVSSVLRTNLPVPGCIYTYFPYQMEKGHIYIYIYFIYVGPSHSHRLTPSYGITCINVNFYPKTFFLKTVKTFYLWIEGRSPGILLLLLFFSWTGEGDR